VDKRITVAITAGIVITAFAAYLFYDFSLTKGSTSELETTKISPDSDPLPSWNSGNSKQKIIEFVNQVTNPSSSAFVPPEDRIATFDNDGTLWIEQPLYIPFSFHLEYLYQQIEDEPTLSSQSPYSELLAKGDSITNKDLEHIPGLTDILLTAYPDITQEDYLKKSKDYLDNTNHPRFNVALKELTYQPMVELIHYLQQNDFEVYIVSAGFQGMMRAVSEEIYNIEKRKCYWYTPRIYFTINRARFSSNSSIYVSFIQ